jgi:hypothetical protein
MLFLNNEHLSFMRIELSISNGSKIVIFHIFAQKQKAKLFVLVFYFHHPIIFLKAHNGVLNNHIFI